MSDLACGSGCTGNHLTVDDNTAANTSSQGYYNDILIPLCEMCIRDRSAAGSENQNHDRRYLRRRLPGTEQTQRKIRPLAVSYTHLDVYKRQHYIM